MDKIHTPHDKIFKSAFDRPSIAKRFLKVFLPKSIQAKIALDDLALQKTDFRAKELYDTYCDVLYTVPIHNSSNSLYLQVEAQSTVKPFTLSTMSRYRASIEEAHKKKKQIGAPLIYSILCYTGKKTSPGYSRDFPNNSMFEQRFFNNRILIELFKVPNKTLLKDPLLAGFLYVQKHIYESDFSQTLAFLIQEKIFLEIHKHDSYFMHSMIYYILNSVDKHQLDRCKRLINTIFKQTNEEQTMTSIAQSFRDEGHIVGRQEGHTAGCQEGHIAGKKEGLIEGRKEGKNEGLLEGVDKGKESVAASLLRISNLTLEKIAEATGLSLPRLETLAQAA